MMYKSTKQFKRIAPVAAPASFPKYRPDVMTTQTFPESGTTGDVPHTGTLEPLGTVGKNKEYIVLRKRSDGSAGSRGEFKSWSARIPADVDTSVIVSWGREGGTQQHIEHTFGSRVEALNAYIRLVDSKRRKGYQTAH